MLVLPHPVTNNLRLADWLELLALISKDGNSSTGDLERLLKRSALYETAEDETIERTCLAVAAELEDRAKAAQDGYPFLMSTGVLKRKSKARDYPAYVFCLCLSFWKWTQPKGAVLFPRRMFEGLSSAAAAGYIGGEAVRFASPRSGLPRGFVDAIDVICKQTGEGQGFFKQGTGGSKDDTLDVIAWKHFPDGRLGKLLLFGQCASGASIDNKRAELQPDDFCKQWMIRTPTATAMKAFFVPHRLEDSDWERTTRKAGIVFDRCRLARWAHGREDAAEVPKYVAWFEDVLKKAATNQN